MPAPHPELAPPIGEIAAAVRNAGGRAVVVGGWVRDHLLGVRSKDVDVEVFGLDVARLESLLAGFGKVHAIGRAFGVFRVGDSGARVLVTDARGAPGCGCSDVP